MTALELPEDTPFAIDCLPYGVFSTAFDHRPRVGVAIGDHILDLASVMHPEWFGQPTLNRFMSQGHNAWGSTRDQISALLRSDMSPEHLVPRAAATMHLPVEVGDYVDFYSSRHHAENVGRIFRPAGDPLTPNWRWMPIGYHGRAGTVVPSGTPIPRPTGQRREDDGPPTFGPSLRLDFEAEVGFVIGVGSERGQPITPLQFAEHVFGVVLINDWSARDIQAWEYVPLGPFLGKSFATSMSPWVVPLAALEAARVPPPRQDPPPLPYLERAQDWGLDLQLEVRLNGALISRPPFADMYWTPDQQLAHMTVNGASTRCGDLFASGTVSGGGDALEQGSLIELTANGRTGSYLQDNDVVSISASAPGVSGGRIGFGEVVGQIVPS